MDEGGDEMRAECELWFLFPNRPPLWQDSGQALGTEPG